MPSGRWLERTCVPHQAPARAACGACGTPLCEVCDRLRIDGRPVCEACAFERTTQRTRRVSFGVSIAGLAAGATVWALRRPDLADDSGVILFGGIVAALAGVGVVIWGARTASVPVEPRPDDEGATPDEVGSGPGLPYRARLRRAAARVAPRASGFATAVTVAASFALTALLLPLSLRLPRWLEVELVLLAWWGVLSAVLATLLYRGYRLVDDWVWLLPWDRRKSGGGGPGLGDLGGLDGCGSFDAEGCAGLLIAAVVALLLLGAAWVVAELALPLVLFAAHFLTMRALGRVANDRHGCEGSVPRALGWGAVWSAIYVAPLAALVGVVHLAVR